MNRFANVSDSGSIFHVLRVFVLSLIVSFFGTLLGHFVPASFVAVCAIVELVMIIAAFIVRKNNLIGYRFLYVFCFVSGISSYSVIHAYAGLAGAHIVSEAIAITTLMFLSLTGYAFVSKRNFSFLGGFLSVATIGLIVMLIVQLFFPFGHIADFLYATIGILIFGGWVVYDVSSYKDGVSPELVPLAALNLYLDFINLLFYVLRLIASLSNSNSND